MAGRAADERHDGRRGHAAARVPRHPPSATRPSARPPGSAPSSARTGRGRTSTAAPASCPRRSRPTGRCAWRATTPRPSTCVAAAAFIRAEGGLERARVFTHVWLALFGLWSWDEVPALPPEVDPAARVGAPERLRLRLLGAPDDRRAVARQSPPAGARAAVRPRGAAQRRAAPRRAAGHDSRPDPHAGACSTACCAPTSGGRSARCGGSRSARAERWIVRRQEADGSWGGIQPPWVYSLMALHLCGYPLEHPVMRRGLEGLDGFMVEDHDDARGVGAPVGPSRRLEACQSPVWDTALAIVALSDAGVAAGHPAMRAAAEWLLGEEVTVRGDWSVARPGLAPGGWAFEFANVNYPDVDDTAEVVLALRRLPRVDARRRGRAGQRQPRALHAGPRPRGAHRRGDRAGDRVGRGHAERRRRLGRVRRRQHPLAGARAAVPRLRRGDRRAERRRDRPHASRCSPRSGSRHARRPRGGRALAARAPGARRLVVRALGRQPRLRHGRRRPGADRRRRRAVGHVHPPRRRAGSRRHQNEDGGWGEDPRSYDDRAWIGRGASTASQTAWALLALHARR